jgi:hypothetical protein
MWTWLRVAGWLVVAVAPGGLVVIAAILLARALAESMRLEQGPSGRRLVRAVGRVRLQDVWSQARRAF